MLLGIFIVIIIIHSHINKGIIVVCFSERRDDRMETFFKLLANDEGNCVIFGPVFFDLFYEDELQYRDIDIY